MQIIRNYLLAALFLIFTIECSAQQNKDMETSEIKSLEYSDGNGNYYKITHDSIIYKPVTKEMSSSGLYDGGEPVEKSISDEDFSSLKAQFSAIFKNKKIHITQRMKTSGMLIFNYINSPEKRIIIKKSEEMEQLELLLGELLDAN